MNSDPSGSHLPTRPTAPIELTGTGAHLDSPTVVPSAQAIAELTAACPSSTVIGERAEASRDWWPLAMHWALAGDVPKVAAIVCSPTTTGEVAAVVRVCQQHRLPLTPAAGRSGVTGASVPVFGGVLLDMTQLRRVVHLDEVSGVVEVMAGTFGPDLEREIGARGYSVGHFPQSFDLATVGGWVACRGAGQYSTRYGKIEDMVVGLEVVLADGTVMRTGGAPAAAAGPDLNQVFIGSEGTLGVVTRVWLRAHRLPGPPMVAAYAFATFEAGIDACRRILQRGATPAVLRLYDAAESQRGQGGDGTQCMLLVLDEGDPLIVGATISVVAQECAAADRQSDELVNRWTHHRNDTSALQALTRKGFVVDTLEIAAPWTALDAIFHGVRAAMLAVPHARAATCHLSHSYADGACLYFTFAATPPPDEIERTYVALWDAGTRAVLALGGNLSHHHGVGLNRSRYVREALGPAFTVLAAMKTALDPNGILNPGKLGLASPFGQVNWP